MDIIKWLLYVTKFGVVCYVEILTRKSAIKIFDSVANMYNWEILHTNLDFWLLMRN